MSERALPVLSEHALLMRDGEVVEVRRRGESFWIERTYPEYVANCKWWDFLDELWEGGETFVNGRHLTPHRIEIEGEQSAEERHVTGQYERRLESSIQLPIYAGIIQSILDFLSVQPPSTSDQIPVELAELERVMARVDPGRSVDMTDQSIEYGEALLRRGIGYRGVDTALTRERIELLALASEVMIKEAEDGSLVIPDRLRQSLGWDALPYTYTIHPCNVRWGRFDRAWQFREVILTDEVDRGVSAKDGDPGSDTVYRHWSETEWGVYAIAEDPETGTRTLIRRDGGARSGPLPIRVDRPGPTRSPWRGRTPMDSWALVDRAAYNLLTSLGFSVSENAATQTFARMEFTYSDDDERKSLIADAAAMMTKPKMVIDKATEIGAIERSFADGELALEVVDKLQQWAFLQSGLRDKAIASGQRESGAAQMTQFQVVNATLARLARTLAKSEIWALREMAKALRLDPELVDDSMRQWARRFDTRSVADLLTMRDLLDGKTAPEVLNRIVVEILNKTWGDLPGEELDALAKSARDWSPPEDALSALAEVNAVATSAGEGGDQSDSTDDDEP